MPTEPTGAKPLTGRGRDKAGATSDGRPSPFVEERDVLSPSDKHAAMTRQQIRLWLEENGIQSQVRTEEQRRSNTELASLGDKTGDRKAPSHLKSRRYDVKIIPKHRKPVTQSELLLHVQKRRKQRPSHLVLKADITIKTM